MSTSITTLFLLLAALMQNLPARFPRSGAQQLINNNRVTVWEATLPKGAVTPLHEQKFDSVGVDLADSSAKVTSHDGRSRTSSFKAGQVFFLQKGLVESEECLSNAPRHAIF